MRSKHCYDICPPSLTDISFGKMMTVQFTWCKGSGSLSVPPAAGRAQGSQPVTQGRSPALLHLPLCGHWVVTYMKGMTYGSFSSSLNTKAVQYKIPKQTSSLHGLITPKAVKFVYSKNVLLFYVPNFHPWTDSVITFIMFNPVTPKIWLVILLYGCYAFLFTLLKRIWPYIMIMYRTLIICLLDNVFGITRRSYMQITSRS